MAPAGKHPVQEATVKTDGFRDRVTMLPERFAAPLQEHLARVKAICEQDLAQGTAGVYIWPAMERKYPNAGKECPGHLERSLFSQFSKNY